MKKLIATLVLGCMLGTTLIQPVSAATSSKRTNLSISSAQELIAFSNKVNKGNSFKGQTVRLTKDIVFTDENCDDFHTIYEQVVTSTGVTFRNKYYSSGFLGTFDGAGHTISGIELDTTKSSKPRYTSLFGKLGEKGLIENLTISDSSFTGSNASAIVADNWKGTIRNCHTTADVTINGNKEGFGVSNSAGICSRNYNGTVVNCSNAAAITGGVTVCDNIGGIVGTNDYKSLIYNCSNTGSLSYNSSLFYTSCSLGGITGSNALGTISNCYSTGTLQSGKVDYVGSICGWQGKPSNHAYASNFYYSDSDGVAAAFGYNENTSLADNGKMALTAMKTTDFASTLNKNAAAHSDWLTWVFNGDVPVQSAAYEVTFQSVKCGVIKTNYSFAGEGTTVTLTAAPGKKYKTKSISVKTASGQTVKVTRKTSKQYQFTMPAETVIVTGTFTK